jgi:hypothetical protein
MKRGKKILLVLAVVLVLIQFIRPAKNAGRPDGPADITKQFAVPENVGAVLKNSCYDCHSNYTRYPWYANIQPLGWWLADHIKEGKAELNFSAFASYSKRRQLSKLKGIYGSVKDGSMPLWSYRLIHRDEKLSDQEKQMLMNWAEKTRDSLSRIN